MTVTTNGAVPVVHVGDEPRLYRPDSPHSFYTDMVRSLCFHDPEAQKRLARHQAENRALEQRTNPNTTAGTGGEFTVPAWLIQEWAGPALAGRVFADLIPAIPLPAGVSSVNVPKVTVGFQTTVQAGQPAPVNEQDWTSQANTSPVVTIAGEAVMSAQLFEQTPPPGMDQITFTALNADYNAQLDQQLINGTGINGQLLGIANFTIPAANTISGSGVATSTTNGVQVLWPLLGQAYAAVGNSRRQKPEVCLMAPRRWAFIASSLDGQNRPIAPLEIEAHMSDFQRAGGQEPVGRICGAKTYVPGALLSTATATDSIYFARPEDMILFESTPRTLVTPDVLSGTLQVRIRLHRYVAFVGNRFSGGLAVVANIPQPTNF